MSVPVWFSNEFARLPETLQELPWTRAGQIADTSIGMVVLRCTESLRHRRLPVMMQVRDADRLAVALPLAVAVRHRARVGRDARHAV